jgi:hydroxymethylbilane synthase
LRIGTRGSALALAQAGWVADRVGGELVTLRTSGDAGVGPDDKSRWVDTIERALVAGEIDLAVHSAKDVPGDLAEGTEIVAVPPREDPRDVLIGSVPGRVGTASLRRAAQLLAWRDDLEVVDLRGNVDTRLRKLEQGEVDAIVLAAAGLNRLGLDQGARPLDPPVFVPAAGQGALALQARVGDERVRAAVATVADATALACLMAERAATRVLEASCHTPIGIHADGRTIRGFVGAPDGSAWVLDEMDGMDGAALAHRMLAAGAGELLG